MAIRSLKTRTSSQGMEVPQGEIVADVARHHFGAYPQEVVLIPTFEDTEVYEIRFPATQYVLKTASKSGRESVKIAVEAHICTLAQAQGVPVPEIVVLDESEKIFPNTYFIMQKVRGIQFRKADLPDDLKMTVLGRLGEALRLLHSVQLAGYGKPDLNRYQMSGQIYGCSIGWNAYLRDRSQSDLENLQASGTLGAALIADIAELLRFYERDQDESHGNCLLHGDLTMEHVWVDVASCKVVALVDFGDATIGDPIWDFVYYDWERADVLQWILNGYAPPSSLHDSFWSRLALYRLVYTMSVLVWALKRKGIDYSSFIDSLHKYVRNAKVWSSGM